MIVDGIAGLVAARFARRRGQWISISAAVAAAVALAGILAGLSLLATNAALKGALDRLVPEARAVGVSVFAPSDRKAVDLDRRAREALSQFGSPVQEPAAPPVAGVIFSRAHDEGSGLDLQVLAADEVGRWVSLTDGRLPRPCGSGPCEALLLSTAQAPAGLAGNPHVAGLQLDVVGRGTLTSGLPVGRPDESGARSATLDVYDIEYDPPPVLLFVDGTRAAATHPGLTTVGRTYLWTSSLDASAVHPWTADDALGAIERVRRALETASGGYTLQTPAGRIEDQLARGTTAAGRLQLVGALAVAVLLAFAVFSGVVSRTDVTLEIRRLRSAGATRAAVGAFLTGEVLVPAVLGMLAGSAIAAAALALLAAGAAVPVVPLLSHALFTQGTIGLAVGISLGAALAVLAGILFTPSRGFVVGLAPGVAVAGLILGWQLLAGESLGDQLLRGEIGGPILILLPAALAFVVAGAFLFGLPLVFRALAQRSHRAPLSVRLALLSLAREPARPAATLTLLALSLGVLVFTISYGDTVAAGVRDQAAFETGSDLRVTEAGTGRTLSRTVVPVGRYDALGHGVEADPVIRRAATFNGTPIELLGLPSEALERLSGWRGDFSTVTSAELARRLAVPGRFELPGHQLPPGERNLSFVVELTGASVKLTATVAAVDGDFLDIPLGTVLPGQNDVARRLPAPLAGGRVIALRAADSGLVHGEGHKGNLRRATLRVVGLPGLVDPTPIAVEVGGVVTQLIRPRLATDGLAIPAVVSPDLAAAAAPDGTVDLPLTPETTLTLRVVGVAERFPTVSSVETPFAVTSFAPLVLAINGAIPGAGYPDEMWIRTHDTETANRLAEVVLRRPPFRSAVVVSRAELEAARASDPFAAALVAALLLGAAAGLLLAALGLALGVVTDLRDDSGELADLEAQGLARSALRTHAHARTVLLTAGGMGAGLLSGVLMTVVITRSVALAAGATVAVPPLLVHLPWVVLVTVASSPVLFATALVAVLMRHGRWTVVGPSRG